MEGRYYTLKLNRIKLIKIFKISLEDFKIWTFTTLIQTI